MAIGKRVLDTSPEGFEQARGDGATSPAAFAASGLGLDQAALS
jgi:hypothetical protein